MEYEECFFDLSLSQMDIYLEQIKAINSPKFNIGGYIKLYGIDRECLSVAHKRLIEQYDSFGIRISGEAGEPCQKITQERSISLPFIDFSGELNADGKATEWINNAFSQPFELINHELFKSWLIKVDKSEYWYTGIAHHIINDGFGFVNWTQRLAEIYNHQNPGAGLRWRAVVENDQDYLRSEKYLNDKCYWSGRLAEGVGEGLTQVHSVNENDGHNKTSGREIRHCSREVYDQWASLAKDHGLTFYYVVIAAIAIYTFRSENTRRVAIGIPVHNRRGAEQKDVIGVFTNITPVCLDINEQMSVLDVAVQVKAQQKQGISHNRFPMGHISRLAQGQTASRNIFDISFNYLKVGRGATFGEQPSSELCYLSHYHDDTPLNITLWQSGNEQDIAFHFDHNLRYFNAVEAGRLADRMMFFFGVCCHALTESVGQIPIMPVSELQLVQQFAMGHSGEFSRSSSCIFLHQVFEEQVVRTPDNIALVEPDGSLISYARLNQQVDRLARHLRQQGVDSGDPVVLCARAGCEATAGMLALLKSGAVCVPVDLNYPAERIRYAIAQSGCRYLLVDSRADGYEKLISMDHGCAEISLSAADFQILEHEEPQSMVPEDNVLTPDSAAYIIYTSGSTGKSRGVEVQHGAFARHILNINRCYRINAADRCLQTASISFDAALEQLFVPLSCGAAVHFIDLRNNDVDSMIAFIEQRRITVADLTASYVAEFLNICSAPRLYPLLNLLIVGNECFYSAVLRQCLATNLAHRVINAYGPTETVITSTVYEVQRDAIPEGSTVPVGKAVSGNRSWIVGPDGELVPLGCVGELYVAGENLAHRYINDEALTAEKFIIRALVPEQPERLYKTGDLVRYREDGNIEYIGRKDGQLKIRGHRVELLEIESSLLDITAVKHAVVDYQYHEQGRGQLIAYIVPKTVPDAAGELVKTVKSKLRATLPDYMIPSRIIVKPQFPQLPNGKIDIGVLIGTIDEEPADIFSPVTPAEITLAELWQQILLADAIDIHTSFFTLGGDSLLAMRLNALIKSVFSISLPVDVIFKYPTIHEMALNIELIRDRVVVTEHDIQSEFNTGGFL
ncbi:non-ribosomal peptide synthetase [Xenorhabdus bovienii]|uniref:Amino acid adenylation domain protein n=1 Tax=Xenorhabdus bovienii str. kraussei Becker Underwood TaxID=1398204 RepID=A0A077PR73_XENBV|nr:amino acid adenylation domain-containing protein [Xenorhabdus bovienii]CDH26805.1 Amino acid adenylation domain protein [Xenorhabdus bovienii str. kraussei Becker Underwood]